MPGCGEFAGRWILIFEELAISASQVRVEGRKVMIELVIWRRIIVWFFHSCSLKMKYSSSIYSFRIVIGTECGIAEVLG